MHFSSAMAVMARTLGIPSRIAVGYAPGSVVNVKDGQNHYEATSDDLHAWTEIYFQGVGWIDFEPTPGVGSATAFKEPGAPASNSDDGEFSRSPRGRRVTSPPRRQRSDGHLDHGEDRTAYGPDLVRVLLLMIGIPALLRWARRRWRISRAGASVDPLWRELEDTARDFGLPFSPPTRLAASPHAFAHARHRRRGAGPAAPRVERAATPARVSPGVTASTTSGPSSPRWRRVLTAGTWRALALPRSLSGRRAYAPRARSRPRQRSGNGGESRRRTAGRRALASVRRQPDFGVGALGDDPGRIDVRVHHVVVLLDLRESIVSPNPASGRGHGRTPRGPASR